MNAKEFHEIRKRLHPRPKGSAEVFDSTGAVRKLPRILTLARRAAAPEPKAGSNQHERF